MKAMVRLGHKEEDRTARDAGVLLLRLTAGGLMAGHGAQKLFGWFGGYGLEGTSGWLESMGMKPGRRWAIAAGGSEFGGGLLTALGLMHPIGPISMLGSMAVATRKVHWGKPIWVTEGGAELPVINIAVGIALSLVDPGRFSADRAVGLQVPKSVSMMALVAVLLGVLASEATQAPVPETAAEEAGDALQGESAETLLEETM
jgi:putative oxidoreductase